MGLSLRLKTRSRYTRCKSPRPLPCSCPTRVQRRSSILTNLLVLVPGNHLYPLFADQERLAFEGGISDPSRQG